MILGQHLFTEPDLETFSTRLDNTPICVYKKLIHKLVLIDKTKFTLRNIL